MYMLKLDILIIIVATEDENIIDVCMYLESCFGEGQNISNIGIKQPFQFPLKVNIHIYE